MPLTPKHGTLERVVLEKLVRLGSVTYLDFVEEGITEDRLDEIINNLRTGMFEAEEDGGLGFDA